MDPDKTSHERHYLIDFARAERKFPGDGSGRACTSPVSLPLRYPAAPFVPSFLPSFAADCPKRGCNEDTSRCAGDEQRARFGTLRLLYVEGVGIEFRHEGGRQRGWEGRFDVSNSAESCAIEIVDEVGKSSSDEARFLTTALIIYLEEKM